MSSCSCIADIENMALETLKSESSYKKPVAKVKMQNIKFGFSDKGIDVAMVGHLEVELEGQKKRPTIPILFVYCPFCGVKWEEDEQRPITNQEGTRENRNGV